MTVAIRAEDLVKRFGTTAALDGVDLEVQAEALQQLVGAAARLARGEVEQPTPQHQVLPAAEHVVHGGLLAGERAA